MRGRDLGYRPDIAYTRQVASNDGGVVILYFDSAGRYLFSGGLYDRVAFKWISAEDARQHPDQVFDPERRYQINQDEAELIIKPRENTRHRPAEKRHGRF